MEETKRSKGRPTDLKLRELITRLADMGYGYYKSVPELIKAGYVDENGNCTVSRSNFSYARKKTSDERYATIKVNRDEYDWVMANIDEIKAYIKMRMSQGK